MTRALKGLNKRSTDTAPGECYLTPRWAVEWLLERWTPIGSVFCDPCACGFYGWSIGGMVQAMHGGRVRLSDIQPRSPAVITLDYRDERFSSDDVVTVITNPPYDQLSCGDFMAWAWAQSSVREIVVLTRFGFLCAEDGARARNLAAYYQPAKRLAFELLPAEGERRLEHNARLQVQFEQGEISKERFKALRLDVHRDPNTLTGYRMSATGVDHGWAVYRRGHTGSANLVIESAEIVEAKPVIEQLAMFK